VRHKNGDKHIGNLSYGRVQSLTKGFERKFDIDMDLKELQMTMVILKYFEVLAQYLTPYNQCY
jgi:hypothetical protein